MSESSPILSSEAIQMIVSSVTKEGHVPPTEMEAERLLNALTRAQLQVPTGVRSIDQPKRE